MSFNSNTYHANRCRREAVAYLDKARDIKARASVGDAYDWELARVATFAKLACLSARQARGYATLRRLERERRI